MLIQISRVYTPPLIVAYRPLLLYHVMIYLFQTNGVSHRKPSDIHPVLAPHHLYFLVVYWTLRGWSME